MHVVGDWLGDEIATANHRNWTLESGSVRISAKLVSRGSVKCRQRKRDNGQCDPGLLFSTELPPGRITPPHHCALPPDYPDSCGINLTAAAGASSQYPGSGTVFSIPPPCENPLWYRPVCEPEATMTKAFHGQMEQIQT